MVSGSEEVNRTQRSNQFVFRSAGDGRDETELSTRVLMALDSVPDYDVENNESVVFDHIDLDALDDLFGHVAEKQPRGRVTFPVARHEVTVTAAGDITIRRAAIASE